VVLDEGELRDIGEHSDAVISTWDMGDVDCVIGGRTIPVEGTMSDPS
jgi:hypothetical protein